MNKQISVKITTNTDLDKITFANIETRVLTKSERLKMGLIALITTWLGALIFILVPFLHFFLVPAGLLLGIILFFWRFGTEQKLISGHVDCPKCLQRIDLKAGAFHWPKSEICPNCRIDLKINVNFTK